VLSKYCSVYLVIPNNPTQQKWGELGAGLSDCPNNCRWGSVRVEMSRFCTKDCIQNRIRPYYI